jgi:hypothetical protein
MAKQTKGHPQLALWLGLYLGDNAGISWPAEKLIGLKFFIVFLSHSIQIPE